MGKLKTIMELFEGRHFDRDVIILCVRWYLRFKLSLRDQALSEPLTNLADDSDSAYDMLYTGGRNFADWRGSTRGTKHDPPFGEA